MQKLPWKREETTPVDVLIDKLHAEMQQKDPTSEEYQTMLNHLTKLEEIKAKKSRDPISKDTVVSCVCSLLGILLIVAYEQKHVITSKGMSLIPRPRT